MELLRPIYGSDEVICSGSKVLSLDGSSLDFVGGMINFEGKGFQQITDLVLIKIFIMLKDFCHL